MAQLVLLTGLPPSEVRQLTLAELQELAKIREKVRRGR